MARAARGLATALAAGSLALAAVVPVQVLTEHRPGARPDAPSRVSGPAAAPPASAPSTSWAARVPASGWAPARTAAIRPGVVTVTAGAGRCTGNFVFVGAERRYLGQAAHCAGTGEATETDGCASGTRPLGTAVSIDAADGSRRTGRLAYSSWITMQARGETDPDACAHNDFALVELTERDAAQLNPSLPVLGGPTGLRVAELPAGAPVFGFSGSALGRGGGRGPTAGTAGSAVGAGFGHEIHTASPGVPGQSGSAFVDADGAAFGVLTTLNLSAHPVSSGTTDLAAALTYANTYGGLGPVTLAVGTEPFRTPD